MRPFAGEVTVRYGCVQRRCEQFEVAMASQLGVQTKLSAAAPVAERIVKDAVEGKQPGDLQRLLLVLWRQNPARFQCLNVARPAIDLVMADPNLRFATPTNTLRQRLVWQRSHSLLDASAQGFGHGQRLPQGRIMRRDKVVAADCTTSLTEIVVHQNVCELLLWLGNRPEHLPDVQQRSDACSVVQDVTRRLQGQPWFRFTFV
mmetsp:Transcript_118126/g.338864  ORF Transcript_118126/g.338864 Transcript_118126/m.338864 type:complete len:203 (+) Transcript_118126:380-988(+)|eukprot:CAMPEP_0170346960 /NCGR_PEP_ID=MMETSP0116_2-20130129/74730_1 /TAXON_ID=400756 /ORGANISM="Durinskia baltica, Strain CSIRO CS-38" /LENGTH=202 /DNA_ID=CAMNT_0010600763 /DNA_START=369 /DNA_END=977 /DNA_ORIENTATION=-